jgi:hypothetical protein
MHLSPESDRLFRRDAGGRSTDQEFTSGRVSAQQDEGHDVQS